jgi:hypothetical protein
MLMSLEQLEYYIQTADLKSLGELLDAEPALATAITSSHVSPLMLACYCCSTMLPISICLRPRPLVSLMILPI